MCRGEWGFGGPRVKEWRRWICAGFGRGMRARCREGERFERRSFDDRWISGLVGRRKEVAVGDAGCGRARLD